MDEGSIAQEAGISAGDLLISINGSPVADVFDYRTRMAETAMTLTVGKPDGSTLEIEVEKEQYEDLGLDFEEPLMDREKSCGNRCVFCFVDQLPPGLRKTLYFKDDDPRLSFLTGNFVTLTNIGDAELDRLISYKLSPMNISVHATDPALRAEMLGSRNAGRIMEQLGRIAASGIRINTQIVVCPEINDGIALERTLDDLESFADAMQSIALVPVGLTAHRGCRGLPFIRPVGRSDAMKVLSIVMSRRQRNLQTAGRRIVFAADEFYVKAGFPIPGTGEYEDFYQLENGVGLVSLFLEEMRDGIGRRMDRRKNAAYAGPAGRENMLLLTGADAAPFLRRFTEPLQQLYGADFEVLAVENRFFGETVTVAGLVTGGDILRAAAPDGHSAGRTVLVPDVMLRDCGDRFLDDMTPAELGDRMQAEVIRVPSSGGGFLGALDGIFGFGEETGG